MSKLTDYQLLSFDVYGTLIDWETGLANALQPLLERSGKTDVDRQFILKTVSEVQNPQEKATPGLKYSDILTKTHPQIASKLGCAAPTPEESRAFGESVGSWPAFPDTVDALKRLGRFYKLVVLSNVDNASFAATNEGPLQGVVFDAVLTAQDIGSYKPDPRNFEYMVREVKERFGVEKEAVLQTAQSQYHDHHPAKRFGLKSVWISRYGSLMGNEQEEVFDWRFATLGEMADAVEKESREMGRGVESR
ncbi:haloacid dehalogenase [Lojkania enalia]|uniref:Haloacid dehalogenase n=1 Tax=Lojkania enalia TaxID=147567 RepID=A0A9P4NB64_9PLEO|nr:haloacid dehalogenase [Didymosphaeria enalia]